MKYLVTVIVLLTSVTLFAGEKVFTASGGILEVKNGSGEVSITGVDGDKLKVNYTKEKWEKGCDLILEQDGDKVSVRMEQDSGWFSKSPQCKVNFKIAMPKKIGLNVKAGSGDISIDGITANCDVKAGSGDIAISNSIIDAVNVKSGSGDISARGKFGSINLKSGSGKISVDTSKNIKAASLNAKSGSGGISAKGLLDNINMKTGNGNLSVILTKVLSKVSLNAKSGSGSITVGVPKGVQVKADLKSGSGKLKNKVGYSDNSLVIIDAKTGSGDLTIENI